MFRSAITLAVIFASIAAPAWSQSQPETVPAASAPAKPVAKKPAPKSKAKATVKPAAVTMDSGPCQVGVISTIGDKFSVKHIGLTVFGNELTDAPIESWGLDDLVVARTRAAAGGRSIKRIVYAKGAFDPYYHPPRELFRDASHDLVDVVRRVTANANCERYLVVTRFTGQVPGTNQGAEGVGVLTNWSSGAFKNATLFAFVRMVVFDGKTFAIYDPFSSFGARLGAALSDMGKDSFFQALSDFEPPTTPESVAGNSRLRDGTRAMVAARLDRLLPRYLNQSSETQ
jgi:hypothetical protein